MIFMSFKSLLKKIKIYFKKKKIIHFINFIKFKLGQYYFFLIFKLS
jgi:hypothetical protein